MPIELDFYAKTAQNLKNKLCWRGNKNNHQLVFGNIWIIGDGEGKTSCAFPGNLGSFS